jgi:hypothetical protein
LHGKNAIILPAVFFRETTGRLPDDEEAGRVAAAEGIVASKNPVLPSHPLKAAGP